VYGFLEFQVVFSFFHSYDFSLMNMPPVEATLPQMQEEIAPITMDGINILFLFNCVYIGNSVPPPPPP
jgi:hypothetical protein